MTEQQVRCYVETLEADIAKQEAFFEQMRSHDRHDLASSHRLIIIGLRAALQLFKGIVDGSVGLG